MLESLLRTPDLRGAAANGFASWQKMNEIINSVLQHLEDSV